TGPKQERSNYLKENFIIEAGFALAAFLVHIRERARRTGNFAINIYHIVFFAEPLFAAKLIRGWPRIFILGRRDDLRIDVAIMAAHILDFSSDANPLQDNGMKIFYLRLSF